jgi:hypothetical protein
MNLIFPFFIFVCLVCNFPFSRSGKAPEFPDDVVNALAFFEDFLHYSKLSRKVKMFFFVLKLYNLEIILS